MPRPPADDDWHDDDSEWSPEDSPYEDFAHGAEDEEPTIPCPYCRREIHEEALRCPHCERYLSAEDAPPAAKPWWLIVGMVICLYIVYRWIVG